jgi:hypothetical protein
MLAALVALATSFSLHAAARHRHLGYAGWRHFGPRWGHHFDQEFGHRFGPGASEAPFAGAEQPIREVPPRPRTGPTPPAPAPADTIIPIR